MGKVKSKFRSFYRKVVKLNFFYKMILLFIVLSILFIKSNIRITKNQNNNLITTKKLSTPSLKIEEYISQDKVVYLSLTGKTEAYHAIDIFPETEGKIIDIFLKDGSKVYKDDILLTIKDNSRLEQLEQAKAILKQRALEYEAYHTLNKKGYASDIQLSELFSALKSAQTELKRAKTNLDNTIIRMPFSGYIDKINVQKGEFITANSGKSITKILSFDKLRTVVYISEKDINQVKLATIAQIIFTDGNSIEGEVNFISKIINETTRTYRVELISNIKDDLPYFYHGMATAIKLPIKKTKAHKIPSYALSLSDDGMMGVKVINNGTISFLPVKVIDDDSEGIWITDIPDKVNLIVLGHSYVNDGDKI